MHPSIKLGLISLFLTVGCQSNLERIEAKQPHLKWNAEITRTCAPWDGGAFAVTIKDNSDPTNSVVVAIWQAPAINEPVSFTLTESSANTGSARLIPNVGQPSLLRGQIAFNRVKESEPVEGNFDFLTKQGDRKQGSFRAIWKPNQALCG